MFSGDSSGLIIIWNTFVKGNSQHPVQQWSIMKVYTDFSLARLSFTKTSFKFSHLTCLITFPYIFLCGWKVNSLKMSC